MNILYIEDNARDAMLVERYIQTTGHRLVITRKLDDVDLNQYPADLILMDINLDGRPLGLAYIQQLRERGVNCPIVALTGLTLPQDLARYQASGVASVIAKPFDITELAQTIAHYE